MVIRSFIRFIPLISLCAVIVSCAALATKVKVTAPESIPAIKSVAIWPASVAPWQEGIDQEDQERLDVKVMNDAALANEAEQLSRKVESALRGELASANLFSVIRADSVAAAVRRVSPYYSRFPRTGWEAFNDVIDADGVIVLKLIFKKQMGGINAYVTLTLFDRRTGAEVMIASFNTQWGKSYMGTDSGSTTMMDGIHGAVNGFIKEFRKRQSAGG